MIVFMKTRSRDNTYLY